MHVDLLQYKAIHFISLIFLLIKLNKKVPIRILGRLCSFFACFDSVIFMNFISFSKLLSRNIYFHSLTCSITENIIRPCSLDSLSFKSNNFFVHEPGHEKMCLMIYVNNKGADQPAQTHSLISAFVVRCLDSIISLDSIAEI